MGVTDPGDLLFGNAPTHKAATQDAEPVKTVFDFAEFFRDRGYKIPSGFFETYFRVLPAIGLAHEPISKHGPVIKTLLVKDEETEGRFDFDFDDFVHNRRKSIRKDLKRQLRNQGITMELLDNAQDRNRNLEKQIGDRQKKLQKEREKNDGDRILSEREEAALAKSALPLEDDIRGMLSRLSENTAGAVRMLTKDETLRTMTNEQIRSAKDAVREMLKMAVMSPNWEKLFRYLQKLGKLADAAEKRNGKNAKQKQLESEIAKLAQEQQETQARINKLLNEEASFQSHDRLIRKMRSVMHRERFNGGTSAVQALPDTGTWPESLDESFDSLTAAEKNELRSYISDNARRFRTRLSKKIRTAQKRAIDIAETCKCACATDGIPIRLRYKKPVPQKANLLMLLDLSGSCREASELMLYLMYCMKEVFRGGCRTYAFVNSLYDISGLFDTTDPNAAIGAVIRTVPSRGVYSDYYRPFQTFCSEHISEVTKDTILIVIGDARNNWNNSGREFVRSVSRKCRRAYWFNTEPRKDWDTGDSVISEYAPYMDGVYETSNTRRLLYAFDQIR